MPVADLTSGAGKLSEAIRSLKIAWDRTRPLWNDATSQQFEQKYLQPLIPRTKAALDSTSHLAELLAKAERDCGG